MKKNGFTLIELLLVIAIISIISLLSSVFYSRYLLENSVGNTALQIAGSLRKAQIYSMMGKQGSGWGVNYSANTITLFKGNSFISRDPTFDETFSVNSNISITGLTDLIFSRVTGLPTPTTSTITISAGTNNKTITINSYGIVSKN